MARKMIIPAVIDKITRFLPVLMNILNILLREISNFSSFIELPTKVTLISMRMDSASYFKYVLINFFPEKIS